MKKDIANGSRGIGSSESVREVEGKQVLRRRRRDEKVIDSSPVLLVGGDLSFLLFHSLATARL